MYVSYDSAIEKVDELIDFLKNCGIEADYFSHLESDYLKAHQFVTNYNNNPSHSRDENGRSALLGLLELYKWIWSVKSCREFNKLSQHLKLLVHSSPKINSLVSMINPSTKKQDDKSNKFIEAIIGMFAVKVGNNVDLDDPINSSNGNNPDVMFDYNGKRIAIACKTIRGKSEETIIDNLKSAASQIERAECDFGYILFNAMNVLPHNTIKSLCFNSPQEPLQLLANDLLATYSSARTANEAQFYDMFSHGKTRPAVVTFIHSVAMLNTLFGMTSSSIKSTFVHDFEIRDIDVSNDLLLLNKLNDFIHNRL